MTKFLLSILILSLFTRVDAFGTLGEFYVGQGINGITIRAQVQGFALGWDRIANKLVYYEDPLDETLTVGPSGRRGWDSPKSQDSGWPHFLPWGLVKFTVTIPETNPYTIVFYIDFYDLNWSTDVEHYPGHDTHIDVDAATHTFTLYAANGNSHVLSNNEVVQIWKLWEGPNGTRIMSEYDAAVLLQNVRTADSSNLGGNLSVGTGSDAQIVASGNHGLANNNVQTTVSTLQERFPVQGVQEKHLRWNTSRDQFRLSNTFTLIPASNTQKAFFSPLKSATIFVTVDGIQAGKVQFLDPWYLNQSGQQLGNEWIDIGPVGTPPGAYGTSSGGVFLQQAVELNRPYYRVRALVNQANMNNFLGYFQNWIWNGSFVALTPEQEPDPSYTRQSAYFLQAGASITASYKGHLATNMPGSTDAQNQRRTASVTVSGTTSWHTFYESMNDAWQIRSSDNGAIWQPEVRMNILQGNASHPTMSNVLLYNGTPLLVFAWTEQNGSTAEIHLQSMLFSDSQFGWDPAALSDILCVSHCG